MTALGTGLQIAMLALATPHGRQQWTLLLQLIGVGLAPYVAAAVWLAIGRAVGLVIWLLAAALLLDLFVFQGIFIWPRDAQAPLMILFAPFLKLFVLVPVAVLLGWLVGRWRRMHGHSARPHSPPADRTQ
jgi:hypothetical protein